MPARTTMGPQGTVTLPEPQAGFFQEGEPIEVGQYRWHLGLWKQWQRIKPAAAPTREQKVRAKQAFASASTRFRTRARELFSAGDAETSLYLWGYAIECRLKVLICDWHGVGSLERAQYESERLRGEAVDLMGGSGHDLELLLDCAGLQHLKGEPEFREPWTMFVSRWSVGWRYQVPEEVIEPRSRNDYFDAFTRVWDRLEEC